MNIIFSSNIIHNNNNVLLIYSFVSNVPALEPSIQNGCLECLSQHFRHEMENRAFNTSKGYVFILVFLHICILFISFIYWIFSRNFLERERKVVESNECAVDISSSITASVYQFQLYRELNFVSVSQLLESVKVQLFVNILSRD